MPNPDDIAALCEAYGATPEERDELVRLAVDVREASKRSRIVLGRGQANLQHHFGRMEKAARLLRSYQPAQVVGILQTPAYAEVVFGPHRW